MKYFIFLTALYLLCTGTAAADYVLVKINMNRLTFVPPAVAKDPKAPPMPPTKVPDDPNPKWISAYVEIRNRVPPFVEGQPGMASYDHKWGQKNLDIRLPIFPMFLEGGYVTHPTFKKEFDRDLAKEKNAKEKSVKNYLHLARWTLLRGQIKEFHLVMKEAVEIDSKSEAKSVNVKEYLRVRKGLGSAFKTDDPAQADLLASLRNIGYKGFTSLPGHYCIYAKLEGNDKINEAVIKRRLVMMEDTLENFYYWFALAEEPELQKRPPPIPQYRLNAMVTVADEEFAEGRGEFRDKHKEWGYPPITGDGFTPSRENMIVMSSRSRLDDPVFREYEKVLKEKIKEGNEALQQFQFKFTLTPDRLLNGDLSTKEKNPELGKGLYPQVIVGTAQTAVLLARTLEDEAERYTVTHASIRQLLIASEMFPRNVQIPDWTIEGLAAFFETPPGALYPTIGAASWSHLVSFKHFQKTNRFASAEATLQNVITDAYFIKARRLSKDARAPLDDADVPNAQNAAKEAWELARCTSWAYVYRLSVEKKLHYLFNFGDELNKLPRDLDLKETVLQASFARAFNMTSTRDARLVDAGELKIQAERVFKNMKELNLEMVNIQAKYEQTRSKMNDPAGKTVTPMPNPKQGAQGSEPRGLSPWKEVACNEPYAVGINPTAHQICAHLTRVEYR